MLEMFLYYREIEVTNSDEVSTKLYLHVLKKNVCTILGFVLNMSGKFKI